MTSRSARSSTSDDVVAAVHRAEWGRLLSLLVTRSRRLDLAEDALAEAFARAAERWPGEGVPRRPAAWLYTTAWRLLIGRLRAEAVAGRRAPLLAVGDGWTQPPAPTDLESLGDERLQLILLCCHPALPPDARPALALRLVIGTSTDDIARLFLVSRPTMAARITRAKRKIAAAGIPLSLPASDALRERLDAVCRTIYLAFTAGYVPGTGDQLVRADLSGEAVELASVLRRLVPGAPQVRALSALVLLQHARRDARVHDGRLVTLDRQDRSLWRRDEIETGRRLLTTLPRTTGYAEELRLQALIAAEHADAPTRWDRIAALYEELEALTGSPVVRLNRAVAVAEVEGPEAGRRMLAGLDARLPGNHRLFATRAELSRRAGDDDAARQAYLAAIDRCGNDVERRFLADRLSTLDDPADAGTVPADGP